MKKLILITGILLIQGVVYGSALVQATQETLEKFARSPRTVTQKDLTSWIKQSRGAFKTLRTKEDALTAVELFHRAGKNDFVEILVNQGATRPQVNEPGSSSSSSSNSSSLNAGASQSNGVVILPQGTDKEFHDRVVACACEKGNHLLIEFDEYFKQGGRGKLHDVKHEEVGISLYDWLIAFNAERSDRMIMIAAPYQDKPEVYLPKLIEFAVLGTEPAVINYLQSFFTLVRQDSKITLVRQDSKIDGFMLENKSVGTWLRVKAYGEDQSQKRKARLVWRIINPFSEQQFTGFKVPAGNHGWLVPGTQEDTDKAFCELVLRCLNRKNHNDIANLKWYMDTLPRDIDLTFYSGASFGEFWDKLSPFLFTYKRILANTISLGRTPKFQAPSDRSYAENQAALFLYKSLHDPAFVGLAEEAFSDLSIDIDRVHNIEGADLGGTSLGQLVGEQLGRPEIRALLANPRIQTSLHLPADQVRRAPIRGNDDDDGDEEMVGGGLLQERIATVLRQQEAVHKLLLSIDDKKHVAAALSKFMRAPFDVDGVVILGKTLGQLLDEQKHRPEILVILRVVNRKRRYRLPDADLQERPNAPQGPIHNDVEEVAKKLLDSVTDKNHVDAALRQFALVPFNVDEIIIGKKFLGQLLNEHKHRPEILKILRVVNQARTHKLSYADLRVRPQVPDPDTDLKKPSSNTGRTVLAGMLVAIVIYLIYEYSKKHKDDTQTRSKTDLQPTLSK